MAVFKCKMCGGTLEIQRNATVVTCDYCGTQQTLPKLDDERRVNLYDRANHFRRNNDFDKAMGIYEEILNEDQTDAEAYWSLVLCKYGIVYVQDPTTRKQVPTVNRAQFTSVIADENYKSALQYADELQRTLYQQEAKYIDEVQKGILAISQNEKPFDVFICYKETDNFGRRTHDSVLAQDLYYQLTQEGFNVFFSRITLEDKLGTAYEPYIFAALNSAKVMVVLGTQPEHFKAVWVKNEWSRFLALVKNSKGQKVLIPAYKDMDPYDLPDDFSHLQAQDMSKLGFMQDLIRGIKKIATQGEPNVISTIDVVADSRNTNKEIDSLLKRGFMFLQDEEWDKANEYFERVLILDLECADAYVGVAMATHKSCNLVSDEFLGDRNLERAFQFQDNLLNKDQYLPALAMLQRYNQTGELVIPSNVTSIGRFTFSNCDKLTSVTIPEGVTSIGEDAFSGCDNLISITIPSSVTRISDRAFAMCDRLTNITILSSSASIGEQAFSCSDSISEVHISDLTSWCNITFFDVTSNPLSYAKHLYLNGEEITKIVIPEGVTSISKYAFYNCDSITNVTVPSSITSIGEDAFQGCKSLSEVHISDIASWCNITFGNYASNPLFHAKHLYLKGKEVTVLTIPKDVTSIGCYTFSGCTNLTKITIPSNVTSIGAGAFADCTKLNKITIPSNVTSIGCYTFSNCPNLKTIKIPSGVTSIGAGAFEGCSGLTSITIPSNVKSIGRCAFHGCKRLKTVKFEKHSKLSSIGEYAFDKFYTYYKMTNLPRKAFSSDWLMPYFKQKIEKLKEECRRLLNKAGNCFIQIIFFPISWPLGLIFLILAGIKRIKRSIIERRVWG